MTCVSADTEKELRAASREFVRDEKRYLKSRERLYAAIIGHRKSGETVSSIEDIAPYRRGRITAILDRAGLVEKKPKEGDEAHG